MAVTLRSETLIARLYFITLIFNGPEEQISEKVLEFDIRGNYKKRGNLRHLDNGHALIYPAVFEDEEE